LSQAAFGTSTQAESSCWSRVCVRLCITYLESVIIVRSADGGEACSATTTAAISPVWLDCAGPGTRIALFRGCPSASHIPAPQVALCWPLWRHEPSVKIVSGAMVPSRGKRSAGREGIGLVAKILKQSDKLVRVVTDGLKMSSSPFATFALAFFSRRRWVRVRPSFWDGAVGLNFRDKLVEIASAVLAHL